MDAAVEPRSAVYLQSRAWPALATLLALLLWLSCGRVFFTRDPRALGAALVAEQVAVVETGRATALRKQMQRVNPEWDFMGRTFAGLAFANRALESGDREARAALAALDTLIETTLREEREHGQRYFLLSYVDAAAFRDPTGRSLFIDAEIALLLGARQTVERAPRYEDELAMRIERLVAQLRASPMLSGESYPDECWTFDNTTALAALRVYDATHGTDHRDLMREWVALARRRLVDPATGLLVSSYRYDGSHLDGPEGSTTWMVAHNLLLVDPAFAREQYALAREQLARSAFGFAWSREWLDASGHVPDVDSGPVVPGLEISAGASGLALVGAGAFDDQELLTQLVRSLQLGAFPVRTDAGMRFAASNQVADAVLAYGLSQGELWRTVAILDRRWPR